MNKAPHTWGEKMSQSLRVRLASLALALIGSALAVTNPARAGDAIKFKWGYPTTDYYALYVAMDNNLFSEFGLEPEFYTFASGAPLLAALKSESLDVVTTGIATVFALGQNIPLKLIYWELDHAAAEALVASPKSGYQTIDDVLKSKKIGAPTGTCAQVSMVLLGEKARIKYSDLGIINIAPPLYANAFSSGAIDAGVAWSPYSTALQATGNKIIGWATDYTPDGGVCPGLTGVRPKFLEQHPDFGLRLIELKAKAMAMIAQNNQLAIDALVKHLSITPEVAKAAFDREFSRIPTFAQQVDPDSPFSLTNKNSGLAKKLLIASEAFAVGGTIPAPLTKATVEAAIDPSFLQRYVKGDRE